MSEGGWQLVVNKKKNKNNNTIPNKIKPNEKSNEDLKYNTLNKNIKKTPSVQKIANSIKLDESENIIKIKKISPQMSQMIIANRILKKWTQIELAKNSNLDVKIICEIEKGNCIYNSQDINKISKALGIKIDRNIIIV